MLIDRNQDFTENLIKIHNTSPYKILLLQCMTVFKIKEFF